MIIRTSLAGLVIAAKELQDDATKLANDSMESVKDADIPDDAKKALEDAQKQLEEANGDE